MLVISLIVITFLFVEKNNAIKDEKIRISQEYNQRNNQMIKQRVEEVHKFIQIERELIKEEMRASLNNELNNAYNIAKSIYNENKDLSDSRLKKLIIEVLRGVRFNDNRGYFFIYDNKGTSLLFPRNKELEGKNFFNHKDSSGTFIVQEMLEKLSKKDSSYYSWYSKEIEDVKNSTALEKIGFIKKFEPFDWVIGTSDFLINFEKILQERLLKSIREIRYGKSGYIFIIDYDTIYLSHARKNFIGQSAVANNDTVAIRKVITDLIEISKEGSGYYSYIQNRKPGLEMPVKKVSYVKGLNDWNWMIGTGYYEDDVSETIELMTTELNNRFETNVTQTIFYLVILISVLFIFSIYVSKVLQNKFKEYTKEIEDHINENTKQQNLLSYQSKMAAMGEMIGNIAHQWRQPLSLITTQASGIKLHKESNILTDEFLIEGVDSINDTANYLSTTIDDFKNFFEPNNKKAEFNTIEAFKKSMRLVEVQFKSKEINIIENVEEFKLNNYENQLIQVIINILNNAKDELIKKDSSFKKYIFVDAYSDDKNYIIEIKDNGGGIPEDILNRIFEPYFTTKYKSQGTGIGLFMSREIVLKNIGGSIESSNTTYEYESTTQKGAKFKIVIPI